MNRNLLRKALSPLTGVAVTVVAIGIALPPAAKAIAAALVQVSNTPTNAVPTMHAPAAAQLYSASCPNVIPGSGAICVLPAVPAGHTLFIETVSVSGTAPHGLQFADAALTLPTLGTANPGSENGAVVFPLTLIRADSSPGGVDNYAATIQTRVFATSGLAAPTCSAGLQGDTAVYSCAVFGYLVPSN